MDANQRQGNNVVISRLKELSDLLQQRREGLADMGPLVFSKPPLPSAVPLHLQPPRSSPHHREDIFSLRHDVHENSRYLEAEDWLFNHHAHVGTLLQHDSTEVQLRASVLYTDLEDALRGLDQMKVLEWERQRSSGCPVTSITPSPDGSIDTGLLEVLSREIHID